MRCYYQKLDTPKLRLHPHIKDAIYIKYQKMKFKISLKLLLKLGTVGTRYMITKNKAIKNTITNTLRNKLQIYFMFIAKRFLLNT